MRRRCVALVDALDLPAPFAVQVLADSIAAIRGRPIQLRPAAMPVDGACGMWVSTPERDIIVYEQNTSGLHQEHIQLHELGHLLCGHRAGATIRAQDSRLLLPDLDPTVVIRSLQRTRFAVHEEQEAETVASLILARARRWRPPPEWPSSTEATALRRRIAMALESPKDRN
jgi:hypothetical protein